MLKFVNYNGFAWGNADKVDDEMLERLKNDYKVHPLDIEDVRAEIHDSKIDLYQNYIFAIFNLPKYDSNYFHIKPQEADIFLGKDFLITIHNGDLEAIDEIFKKLENNPHLSKDWLGKGADFLLFKILQALFKSRMKDAADIISRKLEKVEEGVYEEAGKRNIEDLAKLRRDVLAFRRLIDPQRDIITFMASSKCNFIRNEMEPYYDDLRDYLNKVWVRLSNYKDSVDGLYETHESLLTHRTNETIKALTIISVSLMPLTLLAGIFGMNINLPFINHQYFIWGLFGAVLATTLALWFLLKKKRWF